MSNPLYYSSGSSVAQSSSNFAQAPSSNPSHFFKIRPVWGCFAPFVRTVCRALCAVKKWEMRDLPVFRASIHKNVARMNMCMPN
jgi:hypothetical protein